MQTLLDNPLSDIHHYSPKVTIAQLITFSERKGLGITRAMVQNYIRDKLLPPPAGRIYTHKHLAALVMIQRFKAIYDMPTIKAVLTPCYDDEGLPLEVYAKIWALMETAHGLWQTSVKQTLAQEESNQEVGQLGAMLCLATLARS